jgi:hypothetical protein
MGTIDRHGAGGRGDVLTGTKNKPNKATSAPLFPSMPTAVMVSSPQLTKHPTTTHVSNVVGCDMVMLKRDIVNRFAGVGDCSIIVFDVGGGVGGTGVWGREDNGKKNGGTMWGGYGDAVRRGGDRRCWGRCRLVCVW